MIIQESSRMLWSTHPHRLAIYNLSPRGPTRLSGWLWLFKMIATDWWFGTMEFYDFPFSWEFHHPNWRAPSFFRGVAKNHQPVLNYHPEWMVQHKNRLVADHLTAVPKGKDGGKSHPCACEGRDEGRDSRLGRNWGSISTGNSEPPKVCELYLVGSLEHFSFSHIWGISSSQLTFIPNWRTHIFQRGRSTTNQIWKSPRTS